MINTGPDLIKGQKRWPNFKSESWPNHLHDFNYDFQLKSDTENQFAISISHLFLQILLYPEEGWARTASSSYWTITPCWWQPNRCRIVECSGTQRRATKARMLPLEQQGSLLIAGHFRRTSPGGGCGEGRSSGCGAGGSGTVAATPSLPATPAATAATNARAATGGAATPREASDKSPPAGNDEFKLYLTSNISMEDYNMGYCLTGFVERRCQVTNTFQMTHFAVIKRQWPPSPSNLSNN